MLARCPTLPLPLPLPSDVGVQTRLLHHHLALTLPPCSLPLQQVFCCLGALSIGHALHHVDADALGWWLCERQVGSGGLNGRPEKQSDVCYSWWILSSLAIIGRLHWIDGEALARFILACQDPVAGGVADRPDNMADVFHTFFGIAGLSLLGYLERCGVPHKCVNRATFASPRLLDRSCGVARPTRNPRPLTMHTRTRARSYPRTAGALTQLLHCQPM